MTAGLQQIHCLGCGVTIVNEQVLESGGCRHLLFTVDNDAGDFGDVSPRIVDSVDERFQAEENG